jgi:hypothetical protein
VLVDLARQNLIPDDMWAQLVSLVSGKLQFTLTPPAYGTAATHTIYRPEGNQVLYFASGDTRSGGLDEAQQRLALLGTLQAFAPPHARRHFTSAGQHLDQLIQRSSALNITTAPRETDRLFPDRATRGVKRYLS